MIRRSYDDVPEKYDTVRDTWAEVVNSTADVVITVDFSETPELTAHVPIARIAARDKANDGIADIGVRRGVRLAEVGNGLYPTHSRAAQLRISRDELAKFFWSSLATDFTVIEQNASRVRKVLLTTRELHVTTPDGTDLRFRLNPKPNVLVSDGTIPTVEEAGKGVFRAAYLPAGEVFTLIAAGSADGKLVADQFPYQGKMIPNLTVNVSAGRITSFTADADIERLKATYDAATPGRDQLTIIDFGINPGIENTAATSIRSWVPVGTVTLGFGNDIWAGGMNRSTFNLSPFLTNATVTADGREIVKDGKLII
jgi:leucyl aminopeptidase (aminopeptidase T)